LDADKFEVLDTAYLRIGYALNAEDLTDLSTYIDLQFLEIGEHLSKYYSAFVVNNDSLCTEWMKQHPQAPGVPFFIGEMGKIQLGQNISIRRYSGREANKRYMSGCPVH